MKKSEIDNIFVLQAKRRRRIILFAIFIFAFVVLALLFLRMYFLKNKKQYVKYNENSNIDYKVYLKENNFFKEKYLDKNSEYISSLIDYIDADFKYNIELAEKNIIFKYSRRLEAEVVVKQSDENKPLYNYKEDLTKEITKNSNYSGKVNIDEKVKIDYNHYNEIIKDFETTYGLDNVQSYLNINMYVKVNGSCDKLEETPDTETVITLTIPLTNKTMDIEMSSDLVDDNDNILVCRNDESFVILLYISAISLVLAIIYVIILVRFVITTRTAKDIYQKELKKILNNYHSFIQKINNDFILEGYQILKVDCFTDMLEIHDTLQQPILMVESKQKDGVHFIIPSSTKLLYVYSLKESQIKKELEDNKKED